MRPWVPCLLILFVAASLSAAGCNSDTPEDVLTGYFAGDYQISAYFGNEVFRVSDLVMDKGGIVVVVSRMKGTVRGADQASVMLDGAAMPQNPFPLSTAEQSMYSIPGMAFPSGATHEIVVTIVDRSASANFTIPAVADIEFAFYKPKKYLRGNRINLRWKYIPSVMIPGQVKVSVIDNYVGAVPAVTADLVYQDVVPGTQTRYQISGDATALFSNDLLIRASIYDEHFWDFTGNISLFPQSRAYFVNPYDEIKVEERVRRCLDLDGDGYGWNASPLCDFPEADCDDNPFDDHAGCWLIPAVVPGCSCTDTGIDPTASCNYCSFCINPGVVEGSTPLAPMCLDSIDNNCNTFVDCDLGIEEPECNCIIP